MENNAGGWMMTEKERAPPRAAARASFNRRRSPSAAPATQKARPIRSSCARCLLVAEMKTHRLQIFAVHIFDLNYKSNESARAGTVGAHVTNNKAIAQSAAARHPPTGGK